MVALRHVGRYNFLPVYKKAEEKVRVFRRYVNGNEKDGAPRQIQNILLLPGFIANDGTEPEESRER